MPCTFKLYLSEDRESSEDETPYFGSWAARAKLLYGTWTLADGTEILFDRRYRPIWRRDVDGTVTRADPKEWIKNIVREHWLYLERCPIATRRALGAALLREWGAA